jgi:mannose-6-phosphate isomerase
MCSTVIKGQKMTVKDIAQTTSRPWGKYHKFFQEAQVWVKKVEVFPHARLSLQRHFKRSEKWIVVKGQGLATLDNREILLGPGSVIDIPVGAVHRIANTGSELLVFIEVAIGSYLGEDDIERIEDDYARETLNTQA